MSNGVFNENKKMTKEPKLPHKLKNIVYEEN